MNWRASTSDSLNGFLNHYRPPFVGSSRRRPMSSPVRLWERKGADRCRSIRKSGKAVRHCKSCFRLKWCSRVRQARSMRAVACSFGSITVHDRSRRNGIDNCARCFLRGSMSKATALHFGTTAYPERLVPSQTALETAFIRIAGAAQRLYRGSRRRWHRIPEGVRTAGQQIRHLSDTGLREKATELRQSFRSTGLDDKNVFAAFALVREIAARVVGKRHYDVQLMGGWALLHGMVAEMETGEGKTLTATLAASTMALAGWPVHVITVNDYLAKRDSEWTSPIYRALGLSVGLITHGME